MENTCNPWKKVATTETDLLSEQSQSSKSPKQGFYDHLSTFASEGKLETLLMKAEKYRFESSSKKEHCFSLFLSNSDQSDDMEIMQYILPNMMFEVVVVRKDLKEKKLEVFLRKFLCLAVHRHDLSEERISHFTKALRNEKKASKYLEKIHKYHIYATIDLHEIKEDFSVLSYFINFENVKEKDTLRAILIDKRPGLKMSLRNELIVDSDFFKIYELFEKHLHLKKRERQFYGRLGFTNFSVNSLTPNKGEQDPKNEIFEVDFQIKSDVGFFNAGNYEPMLQKLRVNELSTLNFKSNKLVYQNLKFNYENIRKTQNHMWSMQSLNEGIGLSKEFKYNEAIACYDRALTADRFMVDAYVAKGCALANLASLLMKNLFETIERDTGIRGMLTS